MISYCKVVMYHYVRRIDKNQFSNLKGLEVSSFKKQVKFFQNNFTVINASQFLDAIWKNVHLDKKSVLLTFDDGLKEHYLHVFPILKKLKIQGLFFSPIEPIEKKIVLDVHKLHFILAAIKNINDLVDEIFFFINENQEKYNLLPSESYFSRLAIKNRFDSKEIVFIKRILQRELPVKLRKEIVQFLFSKYVTKNERKFSNDLYLSKNEISEMVENGMYFGSHGYSHEWLTHLSNKKLNYEIEKSWNFWSKIKMNESRLIMCYPYGDYNEKIVSKIKKIGFKAGLTTKVGNAKLTKNQAFSLKRFDTNDFPQ